MTIRTAARDEQSEPEDVEPNGYVRLTSAKTGTIDLRIDMLPLVRDWQHHTRPTGWVQGVSRYGAVLDFWWPDIREIEVRTPEAIANEFRIDGAYARVVRDDDDSWK